MATEPITFTRDFFVGTGRAGARKRWGPGPRTINLAKLRPETAEAIRALVAADEQPATEPAKPTKSTRVSR